MKLIVRVIRYSQGKPTALVVDVGAQKTSVTALWEGMVLRKSKSLVNPAFPKTLPMMIQSLSHDGRHSYGIDETAPDRALDTDNTTSCIHRAYSSRLYKSLTHIARPLQLPPSRQLAQHPNPHNVLPTPTSRPTSPTLHGLLQIRRRRRQPLKRHIRQVCQTTNR